LLDPDAAEMLTGVDACHLQSRPYRRGINAEQLRYLGGRPVVEREREDLALARGQCPPYFDDLLLLQPCLGLLGMGSTTAGSGTVASPSSRRSRVMVWA
jgi:hypothetical protein